MNLTRRRNALVLAVAAAACSSGEASQGSAEAARASEVAEAAAPPGAGGDHAAHLRSGLDALEGPGPWTATATDGGHVTLASPDAPFVAGAVRLELSVHAMGGADRARSVDLVSPTMPMHGIQRFAVDDGAVTLTIPMEGAWTMYVNLDDIGANTAEFAFAVSPGTTPEHAHHRGGTQ